MATVRIFDVMSNEFEALSEKKINKYESNITTANDNNV
jgi:hypothetical protein